jgi:hypothetical protein
LYEHHILYSAVEISHDVHKYYLSQKFKTEISYIPHQYLSQKFKTEISHDVHRYIYPRILIEISHVLSHIDIDQNEATPGPRLWAIHSTWNWSRRTVNPMEFDHRRKLLQP